MADPPSIRASECIDPQLTGVAETLLIPLLNRAEESRRVDAIMKDENAESLVARLDYDFGQVTRVPMADANKAARVMLTREMDRFVRDFLRRHPVGVVVHFGCGLDCRFERVDNGQVEWYDLDLPDVIELRRRLIGGEAARYHLLGCSVFERSWLDEVGAHSSRPLLFVAENVFVYCERCDVRSLIVELRRRFPGSELVFDLWSPVHVWVGNLQLARTKFGGLLRWGLWRARDVERWAEGVRLIGEWGFFDQPEPRLRSVRWAGPIYRTIKPMRIVHFVLGE